MNTFRRRILIIARLGAIPDTSCGELRKEAFACSYCNSLGSSDSPPKRLKL
jgi:hypothetical protein